MNKKKLESRLFAAAEAGELAEVRALLDQGVSINAKDEDGCTPLQLAMGEGFAEIVELLLRLRADTRSVDNDGWCLLHTALYSGSIELLSRAFELDSEINRKDNGGCTPLMVVCRGEAWVEGAKWLLEKGAEIDACDHEGWTPLHYAACFDSVDLVRLLLAAGADAHARDHHGRRPADFTRNASIRKMLVRRGAGGSIESGIWIETWWRDCSPTRPLGDLCDCLPSGIGSTKGWMNQPTVDVGDDPMATTGLEEWLALLGKRLDDPLVNAQRKRHRLELDDTVPEMVELRNSDDGVFLSVDDGRISQVMLFAEGEQDNRAYAGPLPDGITFGLHRSAARQLLGPPTARFEEGTEVVPAWDRYDQEHRAMHLTYDSDLRLVVFALVHIKVGCPVWK